MTIKKLKSISIFRNYLEINIKEYIITFGIFIIGIFLGVIFINKTNETQFQEVKQYIEQYIQINKENNIDNQSILSANIKDNIILALILWFAGTTIIGIPIVLGVILFRGFCLGYTISAVISSIRNR